MAPARPRLFPLLRTDTVTEAIPRSFSECQLPYLLDGASEKADNIDTEEGLIGFNEITQVKRLA